MSKKVFRLFSNCILTEGVSRSLIVDLQKENYYLIPNDLQQILTIDRNHTLEEIYDKYDSEDTETIKEYFDFLVEKRLGWWIADDDIPNFPTMELNYLHPGEINNSIVELKRIDIEYISNIVHQLNNLSCRHLELRLYFKIKSPDRLNTILNLFHETSIESVNLMIKEISSYTKQQFLSLYKDFNRLFTTTVFSAATNQYMEIDKSLAKYVLEYQPKLTDNKLCGLILPDYFTKNISSFSESKMHNSCLNQKISIDISGKIKNCPSISQSFGNIKDTTLQEALDHPDFKKYWNINKDQIQTCKDCEFRYICTDCRAYLEDPKDIYSKPLKCGYNPYTGEWEEWSKNPLKLKVIEFYGLEDIQSVD